MKLLRARTLVLIATDRRRFDTSNWVVHNFRLVTNKFAKFRKFRIRRTFSPSLGSLFCPTFMTKNRNLNQRARFSCSSSSTESDLLLNFAVSTWDR